jgi:hypothetical protein
MKVSFSRDPVRRRLHLYDLGAYQSLSCCHDRGSHARGIPLTAHESPMGDDADDTRRRFLQLSSAAAVLGLAGCSARYFESDEGGTGDSNATRTTAGTPSGTATQQGVPQMYRGAWSQGEAKRTEEGLVPKDAVNYQQRPNGGNQCSGCMFYIEDKNGDGMGACAVVQGVIDPDGWCEKYSPYDG